MTFVTHSKYFFAAALTTLGVSGFLLLMSSVAASDVTPASRAADVLDRFGLNTHIDFQQYGYQNLDQTARDINYLGNGHIKILRDSPGNNQDLTWWPQIASATGAKFDAYIGEGAPDIYANELATVQKMHAAGSYLMALEGGNEEDDAYPVSLGNNQQQAAAFQKNVWSVGGAMGLPVFNISFGAGWCTAHDPACAIGDYGTVGDLSSYATYGNAHSYPQYSPNSTGAFASILSAARLAAASKPAAITEFGWTTNNPGGFGNVSENAQAAYTLEGILDAFRLGVPYYMYYALYDDGSGTFGLFNSSNAPKPAAQAVHNFFTLLGDSGAAATTFAPGSLAYSLSGLPAGTKNGAGGQQLLLQKSDGSFWLVVWNEQSLNNASGSDVSVAPIVTTLHLANTAQTINVYDPLSGITPLQSAANVSQMSISVPAHPILIEIIPNESTSPAPSPLTSAPTTPVQSLQTQNSLGTIITIANVNVRTNPSLSAVRLTTMPVDSTGTVLAGPVSAGGYAWLHIAYDRGVVGWSAQNYLRDTSSFVATPSTPPQSPSAATTPTSSNTPGGSTSNTAAIPAVDTPNITAPASASVISGSSVVIGGISVSDPFGAQNPGLLAFDAAAQHGTIALTGAAGSGTNFASYPGTLAQINAAAQQMRYTPNAGAANDTLTITVYNQAGISASKNIPVTITAPAQQNQSQTIPPAQQPIFSAPAALSLAPGQTTAISGIVVTDPFAAQNPGLMALRVYAQTGMLSAPGVIASQSATLSLDAPLAGINAALANLTYTAPQSGNDTILISVWNQAGLHTEKTISVSVK